MAGQDIPVRFLRGLKQRDEAPSRPVFPQLYLKFENPLFLSIFRLFLTAMVSLLSMCVIILARHRSHEFGRKPQGSSALTMSGDGWPPPLKDVSIVWSGGSSLSLLHIEQGQYGPFFDPQHTVSGLNFVRMVFPISAKLVPFMSSILYVPSYSRSKHLVIEVERG
jgi:hypothetical protein